MKSLFFIAAIFVGTHLEAQVIATGLPGYIEVNYGEEYEKLEENYNYSLLKLSIENKTTKQLVATYYRWNDSSFVYKKIDTSGVVIETGRLVINPFREYTINLLIPDLINDPTGAKGLMRDTSITDFIYDKQGYWEIKDSSDKTWKGYYDHNVKTGIWWRTISRPEHNPFPQTDSVIIYSNDQPLVNDYSHFSRENIYSLLKGKWRRDWQKSGRSFIVYNRGDSSSTNSFDYDFDSPDTYLFHVEKDEEFVTEKGKWKLKENSLILSGQPQTKYKILLLSDKQLILHNIQMETK